MTNFYAEVQAFEIRLLKETLDRNNWNISATCEELQLHRPTLIAMMKKYDLRGLPAYRERQAYCGRGGGRRAA